MTYKHRSTCLYAAVCVLPLTAFAALIPIKTESARGVQTTTFETSAGIVRLNLPNDLAAGDSISGTVYLRARGKEGSAEQHRNEAELKGYVFETGKTKLAMEGRVLHWTVPAALGGGAATFILKNGKGRELASTQVPVLPTPAATPVTALNPDALPTLGTAGRTTQITAPGIFDGNARTTSVIVGNTPAEVVAESPRKTVFVNPSDVVGPTTISIRKNGHQAEGPYRNVAISLSAPQTDLPRGGQTSVTVKVAGLEQLATPLPLQLVNETSGNIELQGGNRQVLTAAPSEGATQNFTAIRTITAIQAGQFTINANLSMGTSEETHACSGECKAPAIRDEQVWCQACPDCTPNPQCQCQLWRLKKKEPGKDYGDFEHYGGPNEKKPYDPGYAYRCWCQ
jgi:hypothetical protein